MDVSDPCSSAREPIVKAGDDLNARDKQLADQQAKQQMKGHELPAVTQTPYGQQFNLGNVFSNALNEAILSQKAYMEMKKQETGANAAALLASVEGDASNDRARLRSVTRAMKTLRECRATQIAAANAGSGKTEADKLDKLRLQQTKLNEDDELIGKVFGDYGKQAEVYADTTSEVTGAPAGTRSASKSTRKVAGHSAVDALKDEQRDAQTADRKQSETLHETLQSSIAGA